VEVPEVSSPGPTGEERRAKRPESVAEPGPRVDELVRHEEEQQDRRMALERETDVLAQAVRDEIEIPRSRARALRLGALDVVLEPVEPSPDPPGARQTDEVLRRLDEDGHLVPVVLAAVMQSVNGRSDRRAKDRPPLDQLG
jgi:hypothetical protein